MSEQLQLRRGTATQVAAFTGAQGEVVIDTTNNRLVINDGVTAGGVFTGESMFHQIDDDVRDPGAIGVQDDGLWWTGEGYWTSGNGLLLLHDLPAEGGHITRTGLQGRILCTQTAQVNQCF